MPFFQGVVLAKPENEPTMPEKSKRLEMCRFFSFMYFGN